LPPGWSLAVMVMLVLSLSNGAPCCLVPHPGWLYTPSVHWRAVSLSPARFRSHPRQNRSPSQTVVNNEMECPKIIGLKSPVFNGSPVALLYSERSASSTTGDLMPVLSLSKENPPRLTRRAACPLPPFRN
jgi:hypothetical protein